VRCQTAASGTFDVASISSAVMPTAGIPIVETSCAPAASVTRVPAATAPRSISASADASRHAQAAYATRFPASVGASAIVIVPGGPAPEIVGGCATRRTRSLGPTRSPRTPCWCACARIACRCFIAPRMSFVSGARS
jgi:hypothetical protein